MEGRINMRRNPTRVTRRSRFFDENLWVTSPSTAQGIVSSPVPSSNTIQTSRSTSNCAPSNSEILSKTSETLAEPSTSESVSVFVLASSRVPVSVPSKRLHPSATKYKTVQQPMSTSTVSTKSKPRKPKKFIRFRFQLDCAAAVGLDVDELVSFLKSDMKIEAQKNNLSEVAIERRNANVNILAKVMVKKKYLKHLAKKFLHGKKLYKYRVEAKNKRAYKIVPK